MAEEIVAKGNFSGPSGDYRSGKKNGVNPLSTRSDEELMQAFKRGEGPAFRELFDRYKNPVYGFVRRRVDDPGRAEEITQDIFLALVQRRNGYEVRARFRTYLYRIALNRVASEHRKKPEAVTELPAPIAGSDPSIIQQVRDALQRLEPEQKQVVMLREYEGLSYQEIADVMSVPVGTVRSRLFRAKLALRDMLAPAPAEGA
jgi:RNA polymerase sigma-70 factor (ECF subfamily)